MAGLAPPLDPPVLRDVPVHEPHGLTRALMGSGELHVLMGGGGWPKSPLRIFKSKSRRVKIQTALESSRRILQDRTILTLFFDLLRHRKVKQGQNLLIYSSQLFVT